MEEYKKRTQEEEVSDNLDKNAVVKFFLNLSPHQRIHYPSVYCIYEHRTIFYKRLECLVKKGYMADEGMLDLAKQGCKMARQVLLMVLRFNASGEEKDFGLMCCQVTKMLDVEKELMQKLNYINS